ncbi:MAG: BatA domain-containing protein, partial [Rhodothermia bacterium]
MTFLNPAILFGLIAAAIPLIIHLFNFRKPKLVDFSSLVFLEELRQQTMRRLRLKQWLLLVLRILAITCLVLAFARPTVESGVAGRIVSAGRTSVAVVLDNSISMLQRDQDGDYFSQAKDELLALADDLNSGDELTILPLVADPDAGSARLASPTLAADWVDEVDVKTGRAGLASAINRGLKALAQSSHPNRELFLISDLQATTFSDSLDVEIPPGVRVYLIPVGKAVNSNAAVSRVEIVSSIVDLDQPVSLRATVDNYGTTDLQNWGVSVYLAGDRVAQATVNLEAGESAAVNLVMSPGERGWLPGYVEIEDDEFDFDNRRYFTLHVPQIRNILVVRGDGTNSEYLEFALSRELSRNGSVFEIEAVEESALSSISISDYDAIILYGVRFFSSGQIASIANFVSSGGGLLILTGDSGPAPDQQALLRALGGGIYTSMAGQQGAAVAVAALGEIDKEHPVFSGVFDQNDTEPIDVGHPAVYRMAVYRPGP